MFVLYQCMTNSNTFINFISRDSWKYIVGEVRGRSRGRKSHLTRSLVASEGWSLVRDRTNRKHCQSHKIWSLVRVVVGEGGRW